MTVSVKRPWKDRAALWHRPSLEWWGLVLLLGGALGLGGSSRGDVAAVVILRPLTLIVLGIGLWRIRLAQIRQHRFLFCLAFALLVVTVLQLVPLPMGVGYALPGRALVEQVDHAAGLSGAWRPISLAPELTRNALYASVLPIAVLVLGAQMSRAELRLILPIVLLGGLATATVAIAQSVTGADVPQPLYGTSTNGSAVGLFANRNHQALFLAAMFPMLMTWAVDALPPQRTAYGSHVGRIFRVLAAGACGLCLIPLLLLTGSRAGLILGAMGVACVPILMRHADHHWLRFRRVPTSSRKGISSRSIAMGCLAALIIMLVATAFTVGRTEAFDRVRASTIADDLRLKALPSMLAMAWHYWPVGSGIGTFERAYFVGEPDGLLAQAFMNHAHNDWLEVLITGGLASGVLMMALIAGYVRVVFDTFREPISTSTDSMHTIRYRCLGLFLMLLCGVASLSDYPLRVPFFAALFVIAALWATMKPQTTASIESAKTI